MICGMAAYTTWEREQMKNYLREIFSDILLSIVTKKYGTSLNDYQREEKADEIIQELHDKNTFTVEMTQALIDKKGFNTDLRPMSWRTYGNTCKGRKSRCNNKQKFRGTYGSS